MIIKAINTITEEGEKNVALAVIYEKNIALQAIEKEVYRITDRTITKIYTNTETATAPEGKTGNIVIIELADAGDAALTIREGQPRALPDILVRQEKDLPCADGTLCPRWPEPKPVTAMVNSLFDQFTPGVYHDQTSDTDMAYQLFIPADYNKEERYPLVIFWHGGGEKGDDNGMPLLTTLCGSIWATKEEQQKHPCFVLVPQCPPRGDWIDPDTYVTTAALETGWKLMFSVMENYPVDLTRIYCTGFSMGGMAAWESTCAYRDLFAATLIYAGQDSYEGMEQLKDCNLWVFHSEDDDKAMAGNCEIMTTLEDAGATVSRAIWDGSLRGEAASALARTQIASGDHIFHTQYAAGSMEAFWIHVVGWRPACTNAAVRDWLFRQQKEKPDPARHEYTTPAEYTPVRVTTDVSGHEIVQIAAGSRHNIALLKNGGIMTWGFNGSGQLGHKKLWQKLPSVRQVAAGNDFSLALTEAGEVYCWGGHKSADEEAEAPVLIKGLTDVKQIAAGDYYAAAVKNDGTLWMWGSNVNGQLGQGNFAYSEIPLQVRDDVDESGYLQNVVHVEAGVRSVLALKADGTIRCWGDGEYGQLGQGFAKHGPGTTKPLKAADKNDATGFLTDVKTIASGRCFTAVLKNDGNVYTWGLNRHGELGIGRQPADNTSDAAAGNDNADFEDVIVTPVRITALSDVIDIQAGMNHTVALKSDGTVWTWGFNRKMNEGVLGTGDIDGTAVPVQVKLPPIRQIYSGQNHVFAIDKDGIIWGWGNKNNGRLDISADTNQV